MPSQSTVIPWVFYFVVIDFLENKLILIQVYLRETDMMSLLWKIFHFNVSIEQNAEQELPKCVKYFVTFVLQ